MSERNTALLLSGHVPAAPIVRALLDLPGVDAVDLQGDEAPRVGHGARQGVAYTHVALRLFELGGLTLLEGAHPPGDGDLEVALGRALSAAHGLALFVCYDDEGGVGGHALFRDGVLVSREAVDGRADRPVRRTLDGEAPIPEVDPSDWVWPLVGDAVEAGTRALFGHGVRTDDDIAALIRNAAAEVAFLPRPDATSSEPAPRVRKRDRLRGLVKQLVSR